MFSPVVELEPGAPGPALGALGAGSQLVSYDRPRLEVSPLFQIVKQGRVRPHYSVIAAHVCSAPNWRLGGSLVQIDQAFLSAFLPWAPLLLKHLVEFFAATSLSFIF